MQSDTQPAASPVTPRLAESRTRWYRTDDDTCQMPFAGRSFMCHRTSAVATGAPFGQRIDLLLHPSPPRDVARKIRVPQECGCWTPGPGKRAQMLVFSYHKSGSTLFDRVMRAVAEPLGLRVHVQYGMAYAIDPAPDIVLLPHALLGFVLARPFRGVRIVRDPRDIWVSAYLYHCRTNES